MVNLLSPTDASICKVLCKLILRFFMFYFVAITSFQCTKFAPSHQPTQKGTAVGFDYNQLKSWFDKTWPNSVNAQITARGEYSDTIPWDFVADRLRKIEPDWTMGRGFQYNGFTLYEVPVNIEDDMIFRAPPADVNTDIDTLSDQYPGSISYLIVKEAGQERYGEVMTIIPTYEFLQIHGFDVRSINLHVNSVYQSDNIGLDFSGRIIFHDQSGRLVREMTYVRGALTYINRHDPGDLIGILPSNLYRAAAPCEVYSVFWRECNTVIIDGDAIWETCTPWTQIGTYQVGDCGTSGGNGNGPGSFSPSGFTAGDDGRLSCKSFSFRKLSSSSNWQEAGVKGLQLVGDWFGMFGSFSVKPFGIVFVGVPVKKINGSVISAGEAAYASALAANLAAEKLREHYFGMSRDVFERIPASQIAEEFRAEMERTLEEHFGADCKVTKYQSDIKTPIKNAVWNSPWGGGSSCF
jgi:hypothetical protein